MNRPGICAVIVNRDLSALKQVEPLVELFEVRIDLIGDGWQEVAGHLKQPWIACNRIASEGGKWQGSEEKRLEQLTEAVELGASIVDIELETNNLEKVVPAIKKRAKCLLSFHELSQTPSLDEMSQIVRRQLDAGADICKVVATARSLKDNLAVMRLIADFPGQKIVSFAMGPLGAVSRVLCPLVGGYFTYASVEQGAESAPGQITVSDLRKIYELVTWQRLSA
ncbi:MAG: type I 3-dehydroquinate dehydratase [Chloroflexi bacterium]|nr:type I 3-dehydroquinate dehydratase [Chloroflexota bacterium]